MIVGERIRSFRKAKDLTIDQLSNKLFLSPEQVSHMELGNRRANTFVFIDRLCDALECTPNELFGWEDTLVSEKLKAMEEMLEQMKKQIDELNKSRPSDKPRIYSGRF